MIISEMNLIIIILIIINCTNTQQSLEESVSAFSIPKNPRVAHEEGALVPPQKLSANSFPFVDINTRDVDHV